MGVLRWEDAKTHIPSWKFMLRILTFGHLLALDMRINNRDTDPALGKQSINALSKSLCKGILGLFHCIFTNYTFPPPPFFRGT